MSKDGYAFRPARRSEAKPLIGLYAESGCGKTYSALLLARGFAGPTGRIGMIETEAGRGEAYADIIPGGYEVLPMRDDFSPEAYGKAIAAAEKAGLEALIIDSASHEWEGKGGVLQSAAGSGKSGVLAWQKPKLDHMQKFIIPMLQTPIPLVIVCMRARYPMREQNKPNGGGKEWVRSDDLVPKQADDILHELFLHGWIDKEHILHVTRYTRDDLRKVVVDREKITLETGERLRKWAAGMSTTTETAVDTRGGRLQLLNARGEQITPGGYANAGTWLDGLQRAIEGAGDTEETGEIWARNQDLYFKIQAKATEGRGTEKADKLIERTAEIGRIYNAKVTPPADLLGDAA